MTLTVQAVDPDGGVIESLCPAHWGDERALVSCNPGMAAPPDNCPRHGPWDPPPAHEGRRTFTETHTYDTAGTFKISFGASSHAPDGEIDPSCVPPDGAAADPHASGGSATVDVTVSPAS